MRTLLLVTLALAGCTTVPGLSGGAMPLSMSPPPPQFATSFDFDLTSTLHGEKCVARGELDRQLYWTAIQNIETFSNDRLTRGAIAAAAYEAVTQLEGIDSFIVTRVIATGHGPGMVCAKVFGRGLRLKKFVAAEGEKQPKLMPPAAEPATDSQQ